MAGPLYLLTTEAGRRSTLPTNVRDALRAAGQHGVPIGSYGVVHDLSAAADGRIVTAEPYDGAPLTAVYLATADPARPWRMYARMTELQEAGLEPDVWVVDRLPRELDYRRAIAVARRAGRRCAGCLVRLLGDATDEPHLRVTAAIDGFLGFVLDRPELAYARLADQYLALIAVHQAARTGTDAAPLPAPAESAPAQPAAAQPAAAQPVGAEVGAGSESSEGIGDSVPKEEAIAPVIVV